MTEIQTINAILFQMKRDQHYRFFDMWGKVSGSTLNETRWRIEGKNILKAMLKKALVRAVRNDGDEVIVMLETKGFRIRESGGLKVDLRQVYEKTWTAIKSFWGWLIGFITILTGLIFIYDRFSKDGTSPPQKQIEIKQLPKTEPAKFQVSGDTLKSDSLPK